MERWEIKADSRDRKARLRRSADMVVVNRGLQTIIEVITKKGRDARSFLDSRARRPR